MKFEENYHRTFFKTLKNVSRSKFYRAHNNKKNKNN